jgi:hypothetical protein
MVRPSRLSQKRDAKITNIQYSCLKKIPMIWKSLESILRQEKRAGNLSQRNSEKTSPVGRLAMSMRSILNLSCIAAFFIACVRVCRAESAAPAPVGVRTVRGTIDFDDKITKGSAKVIVKDFDIEPVNKGSWKDDENNGSSVVFSDVSFVATWAGPWPPDLVWQEDQSPQNGFILWPERCTCNPEGKSRPFLLTTTPRLVEMLGTKIKHQIARDPSNAWTSAANDTAAFQHLLTRFPSANAKSAAHFNFNLLLEITDWLNDQWDKKRESLQDIKIDQTAIITQRTWLYKRLRSIQGVEDTDVKGKQIINTLNAMQDFAERTYFSPPNFAAYKVKQSLKDPALNTLYRSIKIPDWDASGSEISLSEAYMRDVEKMIQTLADNQSLQDIYRVFRVFRGIFQMLSVQGFARSPLYMRPPRPSEGDRAPHHAPTRILSPSKSLRTKCLWALKETGCPPIKIEIPRKSPKSPFIPDKRAMGRKKPKLLIPFNHTFPVMTRVFRPPVGMPGWTNFIILWKSCGKRQPRLRSLTAKSDKLEEYARFPLGLSCARLKEKTHVSRFISESPNFDNDPNG